jgi:threonine dehydrogenase-like Zn-dependent dehydrogenase
MKALASTPTGWQIEDRTPLPLAPDRVRVAVVMAGLCRTDIQAMEGLRPVAPGRILGHEAAGRIAVAGSAAKTRLAERGLQTGDRVAFFPFLPCGTCEACKTGGRIDHCWAPRAVGLDTDGAFADFVDLPAEVLFAAPDGLSWQALAYAEPVAAAMSCLEAVNGPNQTVGLIGSGRIAHLTTRILQSLGGATVVAVDATTPDHTFDCVIETLATGETLELATRVLRPEGALYVKSRPATAIPWPHQRLIFKRLRVQGLGYGDFALALQVMSDGTLAIDDFLGPVFPFTGQGVSDALALERQGEEGGKLFFQTGA